MPWLIKRMLQRRSRSPSNRSLLRLIRTTWKELGFDWLLGIFTLNGKVFGSGGTVGNGAPLTDRAGNSNFPFNSNGVPIGQNPVTDGNRSGNFAVSASALDALLMPGLGKLLALPQGNFWIGRGVHESAIPSRDPRVKPKERSRSPLRAQRDH